MVVSLIIHGMLECEIQNSHGICKHYRRPSVAKPKPTRGVLCALLDLLDRDRRGGMGPVFTLVPMRQAGTKCELCPHFLFLLDSVAWMFDCCLMPQLVLAPDGKDLKSPAQGLVPFPHITCREVTSLSDAEQRPTFREVLLGINSRPDLGTVYLGRGTYLRYLGRPYSRCPLALESKVVIADPEIQVSLNTYYLPFLTSFKYCIQPGHLYRARPRATCKFAFPGFLITVHSPSIQFDPFLSYIHYLHNKHRLHAPRLSLNLYTTVHRPFTNGIMSDNAEKETTPQIDTPVTKVEITPNKVEISTAPETQAIPQNDNVAHALAGAGGGLLSMILT